MQHYEARFAAPLLEHKKMKQTTTRGELGQGAVEYGLIIGLIAIIVIAVFVALGPQIKVMWSPSSPETAPSPDAQKK